MKNQKNLQLQVRLHTDGLTPGAPLNHIFSPTMATPLFPAQKIPFAYHPAVEELLVIKYVAPAFAA